jgi:LPXTG-motif cell wall-anchored protein
VTALPHTGSPSVPLIVLGMVLMAIGLTLTVVARARVRRAKS